VLGNPDHRNWGSEVSNFCLAVPHAIGFREIPMNNTTMESIEAAITKRKPLLNITNALRLVNGLGDDLPGLVLEQYDDRCVLHLFDKRWIAEKEALTAFVCDRLNAQYLIIKERLDSKALNAAQINASVRIDHAPAQTVVVENGLRFGVDLNDSLNSGLTCIAKSPPPVNHGSNYIALLSRFR